MAKNGRANGGNENEQGGNQMQSQPVQSDAVNADTQAQVVQATDGAQVEDELRSLNAEVDRLMKVGDYDSAMKLHNQIGRMMKDRAKTAAAAFEENTAKHRTAIMSPVEEQVAEIVKYAKEQNLPAFRVEIRVGYTGADAGSNGAKFYWASTSIKPTRTVRGSHKRSGTYFAKDATEGTHYSTAKEAAEQNGIPLKATNTKTGKQYDVPATTAIKKAKGRWVPDPE